MRVTIICACAGLLCGSASFADNEPKTSHLPAAVQERIKEWKGDGEVKKIKTRKQPGGATVYEIEYKERGDEKVVVFAEDGSVVSESGQGKGKGKAKEKNKKKAEKGRGEDDNKAEKRDKDEDDEESDNNKNTNVTRPSTQSPDRPVTRPSNSTARNLLDRSPGETRYIYWDNIPEPVRSAALAQQSQQGSVNAKLLRVQTKPRGKFYHVAYEKGAVSFNPDGTIATPAAQNGGPMRVTTWDELPAAVRTAALAARTVNGDVNSNTVTYQTNVSKTLYYVLYSKEIVNAYSTDGRIQDPATYWK